MLCHLKHSVREFKQSATHISDENHEDSDYHNQQTVRKVRIEIHLDIKAARAVHLDSSKLAIGVGNGAYSRLHNIVLLPASLNTYNTPHYCLKFAIYYCQQFSAVSTTIPSYLSDPCSLLHVNHHCSALGQ